MSSLEHASLPVIDYSKVVEAVGRDVRNPSGSNDERNKLYRAFIDVGFVYLKNHSIPEEAQTALFDHAKWFFALPVEEKAKLETGEAKSFHGWFSPQRTSGDKRTSDQKEAFDVGDDNDPTRPNQWPAQRPQFQLDMNDFFERCHQVHLVLLKALAQEIGIDENFFEPHVNARDHFFRVLCYPETTRSSFKDRQRAGAHTDYGTLTLLFNDQSGGLQVKHANGTYIDAPPLPGCAIINVGDMLARWFNDTLKSTEHRVVEPAPKTDAAGVVPDTVPARYSIAWFGHPGRDVLVEPIAACCTPENPRRYEAVYAGRHVIERLAFLHKKGQNTAEWTDDMQREA